MNIYVGNLSPNVTEEDLKGLFEGFGKIESIRLVIDKYSGESKGFGFIEMSSKNEAQSAIDGLNGKDLKGKSITVNEARPRPDKNKRHGGGNRF